MSNIDCRGLSCPQPVIKTKQAIDQLQSGYIVTIVDNEVAKNNVLKLAKKLNCKAEVKEKDGHFYVTILKGNTTAIPETANIVSTVDNGTVIFCMSDVFGIGEVTLGKVLMKGFFFSLTQLDTAPKAVIFMNSGINLALNNSPVLESLQELVGKGTEVLSCGTCLDFYHQKDNLAIGEITNMYTATEILNEAGRVIRI